MRQKIISILTIILALSIVTNLTVYAATELTGQNKESVVAKTDEWVEREDVPKNITFTPNSKNEKASDNTEDKKEKEEKSLNYEISRNMNQEETIDVYKDDAQAEYRYSEDTLTGYFDPEVGWQSTKNVESISEDEAIKIAQKHAEELYGADINRYILDKVFFQNDKYTVQWYIKYGKENFIRGPHIAVVVSVTGEVYSSADTSRLHKGFNTSVLENITKEEIENYVEKHLKATRGDRYASFELDTVKVTKQNDRFVLEIFIGAKHYEEDIQEYMTEGLVLYYELEQ